MGLFKRKDAADLAEGVVESGLAELQAEREKLLDFKLGLDDGLNQMAELENHISSLLGIDSKLQILFKQTLVAWKDANSKHLGTDVTATQLGNIFHDIVAIESEVESYTQRESREVMMLNKLEKDVEKTAREMKQAIRQIRAYARATQNRANRVTKLANEAFNKVKSQSGVSTDRWRGVANRSRIRNTQLKQKIESSGSGSFVK